MGVPPASVKVTEVKGIKGGDTEESAATVGVVNSTDMDADDPRTALESLPEDLLHAWDAASRLLDNVAIQIPLRAEYDIPVLPTSPFTSTEARIRYTVRV